VKDGFLVLAIQPKLGGDWNYSWDVDRALRKIKEMKGWYPIDEKRIYAFGYEKGGVFALIMTINQPKTFAACAALDAKTAETLIAVSDRGSEKDYLDVFAYTADKFRQRPLWLMNFSKSGFVSADDAAKTRALLGKYGYPAVYQSAEGESCALTQKMAGEIYAWFKSQGAA
jgi:predicted peptidase